MFSIALRRASIALGVFASVASADSAFAHFPVSRGVAVAAGGAAAIALPGFGIVLRSGATEPFAYACDALLGVAPSDAPPAMSFAADGSLLIGAASGLRSVDARGCPKAGFGGDLQHQPLARLAVHPAQPTVVYAVTDATDAIRARVFRSADGGVTWESRASLVALNPVTALVVDPSDPDIIYVSQVSPGGGGSLDVSKDGGTSFSTVTQKAGLTLLDVEPTTIDAGAARFWAVGRSATAMGIQGFTLFGAANPSGPWSALQDVRFFGGFARDDGGVLWLGDEAGGVYQSTDGGGSFTNVSPTTGVSCLDFAQGALWACTPGLVDQAALVTWNDSRQTFAEIVRLAKVTRLVDCSPEADVATKCAAAWVEWKRDILMLPQSPRDAGGLPSGTGGSPATRPGQDAGKPATNTVTTHDASVSAVDRQANPSGCSITTQGASSGGTRASSSSMGAFALGALCLAATLRRPRRTGRR